MSFMIVPNVSYQTKQRLKAKEGDGKKKVVRKKKRPSAPDSVKDSESVISETQSVHSGRSSRSGSLFNPRGRADSVFSFPLGSDHSNNEDDSKSVSSKKSSGRLRKMFGRSNNETPPTDDESRGDSVSSGLTAVPSHPQEKLLALEKPPVINLPGGSPSGHSSGHSSVPSSTPPSVSPGAPPSISTGGAPTVSITPDSKKWRPTQVKLDVTPPPNTLLAPARHNSAVSPHSKEKFSPIEYSPQKSVLSGADDELTYHEQYYAKKQPFSSHPQPMNDDKIANSMMWRFSKEEIGKNPGFLPLVDLCVFNDPTVFAKHVASPSYQYLRYATFLNIMGDYHRNDPVTFASVRVFSIIKFCQRHKLYVNSGEMSPDHPDIRYYEGALASALLTVRQVMRDSIDGGNRGGEASWKYYNIGVEPRPQLSGISAPAAAKSEELTQINIINHVRYILNSGPMAPENPHFPYQKMFGAISKRLYELHREELGQDVSFEFLMVSTITKVSYDYILLEKYFLQIMTKFMNNSLTSEAMLKRMWSKRASTAVPMVLIFNASNSIQYSWYFSHMVPFCRVVEASIYNELRPYVVPETFWSMNGVEQEFFRKLKLGSFYQYRQRSAQELLSAVRDVAPNKLNKPVNFKFYPGSLVDVPSGSIDLIQCRDLQLQVTPDNYRRVIDEFHRMLTPDGSLELPCVVFSHDKVMDLDIAKEFGSVPNFVSTVMSYLKKTFRSVKYSVSVLDPTNEVCSFVIQYQALSYYDQAGRLNEFCRSYRTGSDGVHPDNRIEHDIHHYVYIRAEK